MVAVPAMERVAMLFREVPRDGCCPCYGEGGHAV